MADNFILIAQTAVIGSFVWNVVQVYEFISGKFKSSPAAYTETSQLIIEQTYLMLQRQETELK